MQSELKLSLLRVEGDLLRLVGDIPLLEGEGLLLEGDSPLIESRRLLELLYPSRRSLGDLESRLRLLSRRDIIQNWD